MRVLLINNYHYLRGGAERAYFDLGELLESRGHEVAYFSTQNPRNRETKYSSYFVRDYDLRGDYNIIQKLKIALRMIYNREAKVKLEKLIKDFRPDVVHLHNIYHHLSPSVIKVARKRNLPVVMSLHDYKLICPNYKMFRQGKICRKCLGGKYYNCLRYKCAQDSRLKSLISTLEAYWQERVLKIYEKVDLFISPSQHLKKRFTQAGYREEKIRVLPHFLESGEIFSQSESGGENYFLYLGRLSPEKGVEKLLLALSETEDLYLKIAGEGSEEEKLRKIAQEKNLSSRVEFLGYKDKKDLNDLIKRAGAVVFPSVWEEVFGYAILESLALGKPVIASRVGAIPEIIKNGYNGYLFESGDILDLREKLIETSLKDTEKLEKNALESIQKYNSKDYATEIESLYREVMGQNSNF